MYYYGDFVDYRQMQQMPGGFGQMPGGFGQMPGYGQIPGGQVPGGFGQMPGYGQAPGGFGQMPGYGGYPPGGQFGGGPGTQQLAQQVLTQVRPLVQYAAYEQQVEGASLSHAIFEVAAIAYLMGRGLPFQQARRIVETWEVGEKFPGFER